MGTTSGAGVVNPDKDAEVIAAIRGIDADWTPDAGNICKSCGGDVRRRILSLFKGVPTHDSPRCVRCGAYYHGAVDAPTETIEEFIARRNAVLATIAL